MNLGKWSGHLFASIKESALESKRQWPSLSPNARELAIGNSKYPNIDFRKDGRPRRSTVSNSTLPVGRPNKPQANAVVIVDAELIGSIGSDLLKEKLAAVLPAERANFPGKTSDRENHRGGNVFRVPCIYAKGVQCSAWNSR
jgi:hypothetical protein